MEQVATRRPKAVLPLRIAVGGISLSLIAVSYPIALIENGTEVLGYFLSAPSLRVLLYSLLHVTGLCGMAISITCLEAWLDNVVKRKATELFCASGGDAKD